MQDGRKAVWSIPYISVAFIPILKQNFIAYHSSKVSSHPDCIFEILNACTKKSGNLLKAPHNWFKKMRFGR